MEFDSPRFNAELDRHITDSRYSRVVTNEECWNCGYQWEARVEGEYGRTYFVDDDGICPHCQMLVED